VVPVLESKPFVDNLGNSVTVSGIEMVECSADDGPLYCLAWVLLPQKFLCQIVKIGLLGGSIPKASLQMLGNALIVKE